MVEQNIYETLGISPSTPYEDVDSVKKAYRKLALKYHPDQNDDPESEEMFKKITEAYEIANNPEKRRQYDMQTGLNPNTPKMFGGFGRSIFGDDFFGGVSSFFGSNPFFTHGNSQTMITINDTIYIDYLQLFNGATIDKKVNFQGHVIEKKIKLKPRELRRYDEVVEFGNSRIVVIFTPEIVDNRSVICDHAEKVIVDRVQNINIVFKIDFDLALSGGNFKAKILGKQKTFTVPKCCDAGHSIVAADLNLLPNSTTRITFIYNLPKLNDDQIKKIKLILKSK